jgi:hypothetical protein
MGVPLSRVLLDFSTIKAALPPHPAAAMEANPICEPVQDIAAQLDEAYARGAEAARIAAEAQHQQTLAEAIARADEQQAAERRRWTGEQAEELAARLTSAVETLQARIADAVGRILVPFVTAERSCAGRKHRRAAFRCRPSRAAHQRS